MEIKDMIAVLQAAERGDAVQARPTGSSEAMWVDVIRPSWTFDKCDYRIKPKPRMVLLEPSDVPPGSVIRNSSDSVGWQAIIRVDKTCVYVATNEPGVYRCSYMELQMFSEISRDGGRTWSRCEKPESV